MKSTSENLCLPFSQVCSILLSAVVAALSIRLGIMGWGGGAGGSGIALLEEAPSPFFNSPPEISYFEQDFL